MPKKEEDAYEKLEALYAALRDPTYDNFSLTDGTIDDFDVAFVMCRSKSGVEKPVALLLDEDTLDFLHNLVEIAQDMDEGEGDEEEEAEKPTRGKKRYEPS